MLTLIQASGLAVDISEAHRMPALCKDRRTDDTRAAACCWVNQPPCCQWDSAPTSLARGGTLHVIGAYNLTWLQRGLFIAHHAMALGLLYKDQFGPSNVVEGC